MPSGIPLNYRKSTLLDFELLLCIFQGGHAINVFFEFSDEIVDVIRVKLCKIIDIQCSLLTQQIQFCTPQLAFGIGLDAKFGLRRKPFWTSICWERSDERSFSENYPEESRNFHRRLRHRPIRTAKSQTVVDRYETLYSTFSLSGSVLNSADLFMNAAKGHRNS